MIDQIILGIVQGIAEWLPVSSEGMIVLVKTNLLKETSAINLMVEMALFLHLGTLLAAVIYFRRDVFLLTKTLFQYNRTDSETKKIFLFLMVGTLVSGLIGFCVLQGLILFADQCNAKAKFINFAIGFCLVGTAVLELKAKPHGYRETHDLRWQDGVLLGIVQGLAVLPGLSRSGLTVAALLLSKFEKTQAMRLSFLLSIPFVLAGNIILNWDKFALSAQAGVGLFFAFTFGMLTIHGLLKLAQKINFGYFVLFFGILTIIAATIT